MHTSPRSIEVSSIENGGFSTPFAKVCRNNAILTLPESVLAFGDISSIQTPDASIPRGPGPRMAAVKCVCKT